MDLQTWWSDFLSMKEKKRIPHALLLLNDTTEEILPIAKEMATTLLCTESKEACLTCKSCRLAKRNEHPDLQWIGPENERASIKIEQIRALYETAFTAAQLAHHRVFILYPADQLNQAASNALLKLLEEPPRGVFFILIAQQIKQMLATIVSRCQCWWLPSLPIDNYMQLGERFPSHASKGIIFAKQAQMMSDIVSMLQGKLTYGTLANKWVGTFELQDILWWLYLFNAQLLQETALEMPSSCPTLTDKTTELFFLKQIEGLTRLRKKLSKGVTLNPLLTVETILLEYDALSLTS